MKTVLILTNSGLVLFADYDTRFSIGKRASTTPIAGLLRALIELSGVVIRGRALSYIETSTASISIATHPDVPLFSIVAIDPPPPSSAPESSSPASAAPSTATQALGRLLASRILAAFVDEHAAELEVLSGAGHSVSAFRGFSYRLPSIVRSCLRQCLDLLCSEAGPVSSAHLLTDDGIGDSAFRRDVRSARGVDEVLILSTSRPLLAAASELGECV
jgi:hypothetical protein